MMNEPGTDTFYILLVSAVFLLGLFFTVLYYFARYYFKTDEKDQEILPGVKDVYKDVSKDKSERVRFKTVDEALKGTKESFWGRIRDSFSGKENISQEDLESLEELLFTSDLGPLTAQKLLEQVGDQLQSQTSLEQIRHSLKDEIEKIFLSVPDCSHNLFSQLTDKLSQKKPIVWMVVGVNGVGKTTTIGKLASRAKEMGLKVLIVAGDTFRAAADSQLRAWAERSGSEYFSTEATKDPAAVAYQGLEKAKSLGVDLVIVDTAGRLHTQENLMEELKKMKKVMNRVIDSTPDETLLVIDANSGQNALEQSRMFHKALELSGVAITKLDGTSKGGVAVGLVNELQLPIRFIGIGESVEDLRDFNPREFVDSIIG